MTLKRVELRQRIYTEIKENIICGKYVRGQRLIETQIATEYGVNKANIHEILLMLQKEELVRYEPMKGFSGKIFRKLQKSGKCWKMRFLRIF